MFNRPEGKIELSDPIKSSIRLEAAEFAHQTRQRLGINPIETFDVIEYVERDGVFVFQIKDLDSSGFVRVFGEYKVIFVNASQALGRQYYTIAHEYCHILRDLDRIKSIYELPEEDKEYQMDLMEEFAFKFADYFIMPEIAIYNALETLGIHDYENISVQDVIRIQHHFKVSYRQAVRMLNKADVISDKLRDELKKVSSPENPDLLKILTAEAGFDVALVSGLEHSRIPSAFTDNLIDNIRNRRMTEKKVKHLETVLGISLEEYWPSDGSEI